MPTMYAVGKQKNFRSIEEGRKAGFFESFNELAKHQRIEAFGREIRVDSVDWLSVGNCIRTPGGVVRVEKIIDDSTILVTPAKLGSKVVEQPENKPVDPALSIEQVKAEAEKAGIATEGVHHKTLRKQVEDHLANAESGSD